MTQTETFQLSVEAAEAYESKFVPNLFAEWAALTVEAGNVNTGQAVLDVACGTGVVAREAAHRVGPTGHVVGVDINDAMIAVARRIAPSIDWRREDAGSLSLPDAAFDAVLCQAALMFFPDPLRALVEMARVAKDTATVAVQVWATLDAQPAYGRFVEVATRHAGPGAIDLLSAYWSRGDVHHLLEQFSKAGLSVTARRTHVGTARFASIDEMVQVEIESTPLAERIDDGVYGAILADARAALADYENTDGNAEIPIVGHILSAKKATT